MRETPTRQRLIIDFEKCCGCFACAAACPEKRIAFSDQGTERRFSAPGVCSGECETCRKVCPVDAIVLEPFPPEDDECHPPALTWTLPLVRCRRCGEPFTTEKIRRMTMEKLTMLLEAPDAVSDWVPVCLACRRIEEAHRVRTATRTLPDPLR